MRRNITTSLDRIIKKRCFLMGKLTDYNYDVLESRIKYSLQNTSSTFYSDLENIKGNTLITGVGGSKIVAIFLKKVLETKNEILCEVEELDRIQYKNKNQYQNIIVVSASGNNFGVKQVLEYKIPNKYLLTSNKKKKKDTHLLTYEMVEKEDSFISLANTLVPIANLVHYYTDNKRIENKTNEKEYLKNIDINLDFEVMYDYESDVTANFLESTFIEAGLGNLILHDKYSYCHGRSTLAGKRKSNLIYLLSKNSDLDKELLENVPLVYPNILLLESKEKDHVLADYDLLKQAYSFIYQLSKVTKKDLSKVKYAPIVSKLYHFRGSM